MGKSNRNGKWKRKIQIQIQRSTNLYWINYKEWFSETFNAEVSCYKAFHYTITVSAYCKNAHFSLRDDKFLRPAVLWILNPLYIFWQQKLKVSEQSPTYLRLKSTMSTSFRKTYGFDLIRNVWWRRGALQYLSQYGFSFSCCYLLTGQHKNHQVGRDSGMTIHNIQPVWEFKTQIKTIVYKLIA